MEIKYHLQEKHESQPMNEYPKYITIAKNDHPFDKSLIPEEYSHFPSDEIHLYNLSKLCEELNKIKKPFKNELGGLNSKKEFIIFQENEWETELCYIQGKYMEKLVWLWDIPICTMPEENGVELISKVTYRKLSQNQLAHYLYWRTEFKKEHYIKGYRAYYYLFFYELTNGIGDFNTETTLVYLNNMIENSPYKLSIFQWKSEQSLFILVRKIFPDALFQYRPLWLAPQSIDIYIPSLNIGIEYQGRQHYESIDFFGGEEAFLHRKELDLRKKELCKSNELKLIEWSYKEEITNKNLKHKIDMVCNDCGCVVKGK